jgi:hypothetical protein
MGKESAATTRAGATAATAAKTSAATVRASFAPIPPTVCPYDARRDAEVVSSSFGAPFVSGIPCTDPGRTPVGGPNGYANGGGKRDVEKRSFLSARILSAPLFSGEEYPAKSANFSPAASRAMAKDAWSRNPASAPTIPLARDTATTDSGTRLATSTTTAKAAAAASASSREGKRRSEPKRVLWLAGAPALWLGVRVSFVA